MQYFKCKMRSFFVCIERQLHTLIGITLVLIDIRFNLNKANQSTFKSTLESTNCSTKLLAVSTTIVFANQSTVSETYRSTQFPANNTT